MIEKNSQIPMYTQIAQYLKREIVSRKYPEGGNIGTHTELAERFGVSIITIRKAIQVLADGNFVSVRQGKGTFVLNTALHDRMNYLTGVTSLLSNEHISSELEISRFEFIETKSHLSADVVKELGVNCLYVLRTHKIDGAVIAAANIYLPERYGVLLSKADMEKNTVYELYQNQLGVTLGKGRQRIRAQRATPQTAELFAIEKGGPVVNITRRAYDTDHNLIEYMELLFDYRNYSFEVELDLSAK